MGRVRKSSRRNWPAGLTERTKPGSGTRFYTYRGPASAKEVYLGLDLKAAIQAVAIVNGRRAVDRVQEAVSRIEKPKATVREHIDWFIPNVLEARRSKRGASLAPKTLTLYRYMLGEYGQAQGSRSIRDIARVDISGFLRTYPAQAANKYRSLLTQLYDSARAEGLRDDNPVEGTAKRDAVVQRQRLPLEAFEAIRAAANPWFARALDLAITTLQRREDLTKMRVEDWRDGKLSVRQGKVEKHGTGLLRITPGPAMRAAIIACLNSPERGDCPALVHRVPEKRRAVAGREHFAQVAPEMLSREFQRLRDALGLFDALPMGARPTFHEIRALGADRYRESGWSEERVQALLGHSHSTMTRHYLDGHGERWVEVDAA